MASVRFLATFSKHFNKYMNFVSVDQENGCDGEKLSSFIHTLCKISVQDGLKNIVLAYPVLFAVIGFHEL